MRVCVIGCSLSWALLTLALSAFVSAQEKIAVFELRAIGLGIDVRESMAEITCSEFGGLGAFSMDDREFSENFSTESTK